MKKKWTVRLFERKRNPDLSSKLVKQGHRMVPGDSVPVELAGFVVRGNVDQAKAAAKLRVPGREVCSLNVSAERSGVLVLQVFAKEKENAR